MKHSNKSQAMKILKYLAKGRKLTPRQTSKLFDCDRLGARIFELRKEGWIFHTDMIKTKSGKHVAQYYMP